MDKLTYYSFHQQGEAFNETEKFINRFKNTAERSDLNAILSVMNEMGENRGARRHYFRHERAADALPPPYESGRLRLYCTRLSNEIVVLGPGCLKTARTAQECEDCQLHFELMNMLANEITQRIVDKDLSISGNKLVGNLHFEIGNCYE